MKELTALFLLFCVVISSFSFSAYADTFAPMGPHTILLEDGSKIFFLTPPRHVNEEHLRTGLYYNTDPPTSIYYVYDGLLDGAHDQFFRSAFYFSSDSIHFARVSSPAFSRFPDLSGQAIGFYSNGSLIKSYSVEDLLTDTRNPAFTVTSVRWEEPRTREFNEQENALTVTTRCGRVITFDITTGNIISDTGKRPIAIIIGSIVLLAIISAVAFLLVRRGLQKRKK